MPIYEYECDECEARYERLVMRPNGHRIACPKCGSKRSTQQYSTFSQGHGNGAPAKKSAASRSSCACTPRSCGCH